MKLKKTLKSVGHLMLGTKLKRRLAIYTALLTATCAVGMASAGAYEGVIPPAILPTAYQDAQVSIDSKKSDATGAKTDAANADKGEKKEAETAAKDANKDAETSQQNMLANMTHLMRAGNFGSVGLVIGPTSGSSSKTDAYGNLTSSATLDKAGMATFDNNFSGGNGKVYAYHTFGLAMTHLKSTAKKTPVSVMGADKTVAGFEAVAKAFAKFGLNVIREYNPLPVVAAFYDSSNLNNAAYTGRGTDSNALIQMVNQNAMVSGAIRVFGDPIMVGGRSVSRAFMITGVIAFMSLGYAAFLKLWNGQRASIQMRKALVRIAVASVAVPLIAIYGSKAMSWANKALENNTRDREQVLVENNLNIYAWYKNTNFGLPPGVSLKVVNGYFQFDAATIKAINEFSANNNTSATGESGVEKVVNGIYKNVGKTFGTVKTDKNGNLTAGSELEMAAHTNDNKTKVTFTPTYGQVGAQGVTGGATPWDTSSISQFAEALGENKKYEGKDKEDVTANPYINVTGLSAAPNGAKDGTSYTYTGNGQYGMSPLAAYNLMATNFSNTSMVVSTNTGNITTPTVAPGIVYGSGKEQAEAPALLKLVMMVTMVGVGMKAVMTILSAGFGGLFKGAAGATLGSTAGFGTAVGGVIALVVGMLGLSVIMTIALDLVDVVWSFISKLLFSSDTIAALDGIADDMLGGLGDIPLIGGMLKSAITGIASLVMTIVGLMMLPQLVKTPITAWGEFMAGIPSGISERFATWERVFTGDYHSGGGSFFGGGSRGGGGGLGGGGGSATSAMKQAEAKKRGERGKAMKVGGAMIAGAGLSYLGAKISNKADKMGKTEGGKDESIRDGDENQEVTNDMELTAKDMENSQEDIFNEGAAAGEGDSQAEDLTPPVEEPLMDPPTPLEADGMSASDMTEVNEESLDDMDNVEEGSSVANEVSEEGPVGDPIASADSETPVGDAISEAEALGDAEALGAMEGPDGVPVGDAGLASDYKEGADGSRDQSHSEKSQQDKTHSDRNKDHSDSQREKGAAGDVKSLNSSSQGGDSKVDQSKSLSKNSASGQTTNNQSGTTNETDASKASQESKVAADSHSNAKSLSQVSKAGNTTNVDAKEKSGQSKTDSKTDKGKAKDGKRESRISKVRQSMTKQNVVGAVGKGLQGLGGQMVGSENQGKDALKMMGAGALHAAGGLTGTQRVTTRTAQNQIDKRNERLRRAGKDVPDNLSAVGETREQARKRVDDRIRSQDEMMAAQMSQDYDQKKDNEAKERGRRAAEARKKRSESKK